MQNRSFLALDPQCPQCGAAKIVYSCEPRCCFNHVCSACRASFQLQTLATGTKLAAELFTSPLPVVDSCMPTAACANCESLKVYQMLSAEHQQPIITCSDCYTVLELCFAADE